VAEGSGCVAAEIELHPVLVGPACALDDFGLAYSTWLFGLSAAGLVGCSKRRVPVAVE
jgi:hypothetical protein